MVTCEEVEQFVDLIAEWEARGAGGHVLRNPGPKGVGSEAEGPVEMLEPAAEFESCEMEHVMCGEG
jgi:hypothetical protein